MNKVNFTNENLSLRTQELLKSYTSKKTANPSSKTAGLSYDELIAKVSKETESRIQALKSGSKETTKTATLDEAAAEKTNVLNVKKDYFKPVIISGNTETKVYTGPIDKLGEKVAAAKNEAAGDAKTNGAVEKTFTYKKAVEDLALKHNINEKMKTRNIDTELDALIAKKLTGTKNEALMIRSDIPTTVQNYQVKKGDTLASIAKEVYNDAFMFKNIATVNEQKAPYKLAEGQNLRIVYHQVKAGENDTFESISEKYTDSKVPANTLAKINNGAELKTGDTVLIPVQFTPVSTDTEKVAVEKPQQKQAENVMISKMPPNASASNVENVKRQIEKYASQIDRINL
ncbi:MAG TPA: LysM peptidoglycan-binding domain-containing protein [Candidatus Wallbacteria bacterium]|nr:LysM peptidoglycan-binding domain-containing protein [Candidatus Wallbacteria bacterium]